MTERYILSMIICMCHSALCEITFCRTDARLECHYMSKIRPESALWFMLKSELYVENKAQ
ncbi:hypothetical protein Hanom_Chr06g00526191 [Helianthus anomalus]